jgi:ligand-binding sensor domain-containing protein
MKTITVALNTILLIGMLAAVTSCNGQSSAKAENSTGKPAVEAGVTVSRLGDSIWQVYQDRKNNLWFGSNGQGVFRYDGKTIRNFTTKSGLCNDSIRQILEDESGNMYFSTLGGINKFDGERFTTLHPVKSNEWKLEKNDMWFYMLGKRDEHGPYRWDGKNLYNLQFPQHFLHDEFYAKGINPFFSPYEIYSIYKDRSGALWFGTSVFGACRFDGKTLKWMYERDLTIVPNGGSFGIRSVYEDRQGSFWICNTMHRYIFDLEETARTDRLKYRKVTGIGNAQAFGGDDCIYYSASIEDNQGNIWLTTWAQGVYRYDGKNITHYPVKEGSKNVNLVSMYKDNQGSLWLGTPENGTFRFNGKAFERFMPVTGIQ